MFLEYAQGVYYDKSIETPKGNLSCTENASEVRIRRAGPDGSVFFEHTLPLSR